MWQCDNDNRKWYKYVCITTYQTDTKSNPNPNPTTKQHTVKDNSEHSSKYSNMSYISG